MGVSECPSMVHHMATTNRLDKLTLNQLIADMLHDIHTNHGDVFNSRSLRRTLHKVAERLSSEGESFLTKTLPRLGKALDRALAGGEPLDARNLRFAADSDGKLPKLFGEFFRRVLQKDGTVLQEPDSNSVVVLRQLLYCFYKYELPYTDEQEQTVVSKFERTEEDLSAIIHELEILRSVFDDPTFTYRRIRPSSRSAPILDVVRRARILLSSLFARFDPKDIYPRHGPGAVATKQKLWTKYLWTNVSANITRMYPLDAYFFASSGAVCDNYMRFDRISEEDLPARVVLVPKDSRGPRLISCEPVDYQWIQQGLGKAIVDHVEKHPLTKWNVHYTDQGPNQRGALLGSSTGRYATLDLNEASDRVSLSLVRLLFPPHITCALEACRSSSTVLPDGRILPLHKFAPMGSSLCFPILALTVWSILTAAAPDRDARESILVYGDDVVVPTAFADEAIERLEALGLKVNREKSCTSGFFRESCGVDAFKGKNVTPVRIRTVWSSRQSADVYTSWIAYANSLFAKRYYTTYNRIVGVLETIYGPIPTKDLGLNCPSLVCAVTPQMRLNTRVNANLQKLEYNVWDVRAQIVTRQIDGWSMLLRYFAESGSSRLKDGNSFIESGPLDLAPSLRVRQYTPRRASILARCWR